MTTRNTQRRAAALGIASAPLIAAGFLLIGVEAPGPDEPGPEYVSYYIENNGQIWIGAILTLLGLAALMAFLAGGLRDVLANTEPEEGKPAGVVLAAGSAYALFTLAAVTVTAGTAGAADFFEGFTLDEDTARLMLGMTWLPSIYGGLAATVAVAAASLSARRSAALPAWFARMGFLVAALLLVTAFTGASGPLFALWVLGASLVLLRRTGDRSRPAAGPALPAAGLHV